MDQLAGITSGVGSNGMLLKFYNHGVVKAVIEICE